MRSFALHEVRGVVLVTLAPLNQPNVGGYPQECVGDLAHMGSAGVVMVGPEVDAPAATDLEGFGTDGGVRATDSRDDYRLADSEVAKRICGLLTFRDHNCPLRIGRGDQLGAVEHRGGAIGRLRPGAVRPLPRVLLTTVGVVVPPVPTQERALWCFDIPSLPLDDAPRGRRYGSRGAGISTVTDVRQAAAAVVPVDVCEGWHRSIARHEWAGMLFACAVEVPVVGAKPDATDPLPMRHGWVTPAHWAGIGRCEAARCLSGHARTRNSGF